MQIYFFFFIYNSRKDGLKELIFNDTLQALSLALESESQLKKCLACARRRKWQQKSELPPFFKMIDYTLFS